jgi:hypothetical protein
VEIGGDLGSDNGGQTVACNILELYCLKTHRAQDVNQVSQRTSGGI